MAELEFHNELNYSKSFSAVIENFFSKLGKSHLNLGMGPNVGRRDTRKKSLQVFGALFKS